MADNSRTNPTAHSEPIPINTRMGRGRSASVSSASSSSASSPSEIPTPISSANSSVRIAPASPGSSPILNYFFNQSPSKPPPGAQNTYPFRKFGPPPVFEEVEEGEPPVHAHARRASNATAGRFAQPQGAMPASDSTFERGTGILRRLSLSSSFAKPNDPARRSPPNAPPNSAVSPVEPRQLPPFSREGGGKPRRSATISMDSKPRRAPSPMGERILKGHFDGFN